LSMSGLVLFETKDEEIKLQVNIDGDTVWLNRTQMASLFQRDIKTIGKHINNAIREELQGIPTVAKFATVQKEGERTIKRNIDYYNLDVIISVGYRVQSIRGIEFRRWANNVLKKYILEGVAVNNRRLLNLGEVVKILKRTEHKLESEQILNIIESFTTALDLLDDYDHQSLKKPKGTLGTYVLNYEECINVIESMKFNSQSDLFGKEKDNSFKSSIGAIYQTFDEIEVYNSVEEKAANLLYFVTKNHSFLDGNKRIAAAVFLYFLSKNKLLFENGKKRIEDNTLVAITIMIAESKAEEKEAIISLLMNFLNN